jgi:hypothetical protein
MAEFDGEAPGPFRGRIAECKHEWMNTLEQPAQDTRAQSQLAAGSDPRQLEGALLTANWNYHLYADPGQLGRARHAVQACLVSEANPAGRRALRSAPQTGETSSTADWATRREQR